MKIQSIYRRLLLACGGALCAAILCFGGPVKACDLSQVSLVSVTGSGPYVLTVQLCIGMGITGATKGAGQRTTTISFGFFDADPGFTISAFTPAQMVSPAPAQTTTPSNCTMPGSIAPASPTLGTDASVYYIMPSSAPCTGINGTSYGCVTSTALCGNAISSCSTYTFTVNQIPDSMRVFGVEGAGNPVGGCYPNADMLVLFPILSARWGTVEAIAESGAVRVEWQTLNEVGSDYFIVERSNDGRSFAQVGQVLASGFSASALNYSFMDDAPLDGKSYYRVVEVSQDGRFNDSEVVEAEYFRPSGYAWGAVGPNPCHDFLDIAFSSPQAGTVDLAIYDLAGHAVLQTPVQAIAGGNRLRLATDELASGSYYLQVRGEAARITRLIRKF